jgi:glycosyltransferase involved in cell wall biosynthesis
VKVALLVHTDVWGGTEVYTAELAEALVRQGHQVTIVQLGHRVYEHLRSEERGFEVAYVEVGTSFERAGLVRWLSLLRPLAADVGVLIKTWHRGTSLPLELASRLRFRRYLVIELHPADPPPTRARSRHLGGLIPGLALWWYRERLSWEVLKRLPRKIIALSDAVVHNLVRDYGYDRAAFLRIHAGVDTEAFRPDPQRRAAARAAWGVGPDTVVFGAVGRLATVKGFDVALEQFARLVARNPDRQLRLVLAGAGPEAERLRAQAQRARLNGCVLFPGWAESSQDVLCGLDVFLMPSRQEGLGLALVEAMASACCPIAMGVGGVAEVLTDPATGWLVSPGDAEEFLQAMEAALTATSEERRAMGERACAHVVRYFHAAEQFRRIAEAVETA